MTPAASPILADDPARIAPSGTQGEAIPCPLCDYDLRGLADPRCPECGYCFTWDELSDPARRFHPYLFEHHPERNARAFARTLLAGVLPRRFWSTLYPTQPSRPQRLVTYWALCAIPLLMLAAVQCWLIVSETVKRFAPRLPPRLMWQRYADWSVMYDKDGGGYVRTSVALVLWPWLTLATLLVFRVSMRQARLRPTHVLRCVLYTSDLALYFAVPFALVILFTIVGQKWPPKDLVDGLGPLLALAAWLLLCYRLFTAYRLYLRFDHPLATVVASQVMVALVYWKLWYVAQGL